jgi:hypothetical protein
MLRRIHRQLKLIRYYSAARPQTAWAKALEWALVLALLLAAPAMLLSELAVTRTAVTMQVQGQIVRGEDGAFLAVVQESPTNAWWPVGAPYGEFFIELAEIDRGWPFTSSFVRQPARLDLNLFAEQGMRKDVQLRADSPLRAAIEKALSQPEHRRTLEATSDRSTYPARRYWLGSIVGAVIWWMILSFASFILIRFVQFGTMVVLARRAEVKARRIARGRCPVCGYDMRGLEFNERCPECGSLVH